MDKAFSSHHLPVVRAENGQGDNRSDDIGPVGAPMEKTTVPGVYKRGGRYAVIFRDATGKQRQRSAATLAEARVLKAELTADVSRGEYREQSRITFGDYADEWMRTYTGRTSRGIRPATMRGCYRDLRLHVLPVLGPRRLGPIEPRHARLPGGRSGRGGEEPRHRAQHHGPGAGDVRDGRR